MTGGVSGVRFGGLRSMMRGRCEVAVRKRGSGVRKAAMLSGSRTGNGSRV